MIIITRYLILLLSFFLSTQTVMATVPVMRYPSGTPVQVCQASDSNTLCGGGGGSSGTINAGSVNIVPIYVGVNTLGPSSNVYIVGSNMGIGTTTPGATLEIVKQSSNPPFMVSSTATGAGDYLRISSGGAVGIGTTIVSATNAHLAVVGGNVGIGTWKPVSVLEAVGTVTATTFSGDGTSLTGTASLLTAGNVTTNANLTGDVTSVGNATTLATVNKPWQDGGANIFLTTTTDLVGIGTTTPATTLEIVKQSSSAPLMISSVATGAGDYLIVNSGGNVGINKTAPINFLDVNGGSAFGTYSGNFTAPTNGMLVSGNVGIGTSAVTNTRLIVINSASALAAVYKGSTSSTVGGLISTANGPAIQGYSTLAIGGTTNLFLQPTNSNVGIGTIVSVSKLSVGGSTAIGSSYAGAAAPTDGLIVQGNVGIGTTDAASGALTVMNGNVGIGTWKPASTFEIAGTGFRYNGTTFTGVSGSGNICGSASCINTGATTFSIVRAGTASGAVLELRGSTSGSATAATGMNFAYNPGGNVAQAMRLEGLTGNFGIGTWVTGSQMGNKLNIDGTVGIGIGTTSVFNTTTAPSGGMIIEGNVGIGTTKAADGKLHLPANGTATGQAVCFGTNNCLGYCTAGTYPACSTCTCF